jgi:hypothetical protein
MPKVRIDEGNGRPVEQCEASCLNTLNSQLNRNEPTHKREPCSQSVQEEHFVDAAIAAQYLSCSRKHVLRLSDQGLIPAHPLPGSAKRRTWRYLLSELRAWMLAQSTIATISQTETSSRTMPVGSPRKGGR